MSSGKNLASSRRRSPPRKPDPSPVSEMLTPSEIESLRQDAKETDALMEKAFLRLERAKKTA